MADRSLWVKLGLDNKKYDQGIDKASKRTSKLSGTVKKLGATIGGAFAVKKIAGFVSETAKLGDELGKLSKQTGLSTEALQKYQFAAERTGVSKQKLNSSLERFQKRLGMAATGSGSLANQLGKLNPTLLKNMQNAENTNEAFRMYMDAMGNVSDEAERAAMAQAGFGREGLKLVNMARGGTETIDAYGKELEDLGGVLSEDLIRASEKYQDRMENMRMAMRGLKGIIAKVLMPVFNDIIKKITQFAGYIRENQQAIISWLKVGGKIAGVLAGIKVAWIALNAAMNATTIGLILSGVAALVSGLIALWHKSEKFRVGVKYVWEAIKYYFTLAKDFVAMVGKTIWSTFETYFGAIGDLAGTAWDAIKAAFQSGKSPGDILKSGLAKIKNDFANIGKEAAAEFKEKMEKNSKPTWDEVLQKDRAKQQGFEAGKETGKEFQRGMQAGQAGGAGMGARGGAAMGGEMEGQGITPFSTEKIQPELANMDRFMEKNRQIGESLKRTGEKSDIVGGIMSNAFQGMQNSITNAMEGSKNVLQGFWTFFKDFIKGLITKLIAAAAAAAALAIVLQAVGVPTGGVAGVKSAMSFAEKFTTGMKNLSGLAEGGRVSSGGNFLVGERGPEMVNLPTGSAVTPNNQVNKLGNAGGRREELTARVSGEDLEFVLNKWGRNKKRIT